MNKMLKIFAVVAFAAGLALPGVARADHHHGGSHVFLGFNFGAPAYYYPPPAYYPPPPVYYAPPPVYYAPPPPVVVYQPPQPVYAAPAPAPTASNCRTYNGDATIDASGRPFYGTACLGPDGRWHIQ